MQLHIRVGFRGIIESEVIVIISSAVVIFRSNILWREQCQSVKINNYQEESR